MTSSRPVRVSTPGAMNGVITFRTRINPGAMNGVITFRARINPGAMNGAPTGKNAAAGGASMRSWSNTAPFGRAIPVNRRRSGLHGSAETATASAPDAR